MELIRNFINGRLVDGNSQRTAPVFNPATGKHSKNVVLSSADETRAAVRSARRACDTDFQ